MKVYNRNNILFSIYSLIVLLTMIIKTGTRAAIIILSVILTGKVFELILRLIYKNRREYVPFWLLLIIPAILPVNMPIPLILISVVFSLLITSVFISGGSKLIISPIPVLWIFAALSFPDYFTSSYNNIIVIFIIIPGILLMLFRVTSYLTILSFIATYLSVLVLNNEFDIEFVNSLSGNLVISTFIILPNISETSIMPSGRVIIGILGGISIYIINKFSTHSDGTMFTVLLCQIFTPLVDDILLKMNLKKRMNNA